MTPTTPFSKSSSTLARLPMAHACRKLMMSPGAEFNLATRLVRWWAWSPTLSRSWSAKPSLSTWPPACCWRCLIYVGSPCPSYRPPPAPWSKKNGNVVVLIEFVKTKTKILSRARRKLCLEQDGKASWWCVQALCTYSYGHTAPGHKGKL